MHYAICYDIENDQLREKTAKTLRRHGAERVQKSVFTAAFMHKRDLKALHADLKRLYARRPLSPADSVLLLPLRDEHVPKILVLGQNNIRTNLTEKKLKIIL